MGDNTGLFGLLNVNQNNTVTTVNVNTSSTVATGSVNTITVGAGKTLTNTGTVTVGVGAATTNFTNLTVTGGAGSVWNVNGTTANANFQVGVNLTTNLSNAATVDLTGLPTFTASLGTGSFIVGETANTGGTGTAGSIVKLSPTSTIFAATISSDSADGSNTGSVSTPPAFVESIVLGTTANTFNANTINIGMTVNRSPGTLGFATGAGTFKVRNELGTGRALFTVGYGASGTGFNSFGNSVDLTGHSSDLLLSALDVGGKTVAGTGGSNSAVFKFDTGILDTTGIIVGSRGLTTASSNTTGDIQLGGGAITVGASGILIGQNTSTVSTSTATGSIELSGAAAVTVGATSNVSITLGTSATAAQVATASLSISGTSSLTLTGDLIKGTGPWLCHCDLEPHPQWWNPEHGRLQHRFGWTGRR